MTTYTATSGIDTFPGTASADIFVVSDVAHLTTGDSFAGGGGTDTVRLVSNGMSYYIYSLSEVTLSSIEALAFQASVSSPVMQAFLTGSQFGAGISNSLAVTGASLSSENIFVGDISGAFTAAGWTFTTWSGSDSVSLSGASAADTITGSSGADHIFGNAGNDTLNGGNGSDELRGGNDNDTLSGGALGDELYGDAGNDTINGDDGDDVIYGGVGADAIDGGAGSFDQVGFGGAVGVTVSLATGVGAGGEAAGDTYLNIENVLGTGHADTLIGNASNNILNGSSGNDLLDGGLGADTLTGGSGVDTVTYANSSAGVIVSLAGGGASGGDAAGDALTSIENLIGSAHSDTLTGGTDSNLLQGGGGDDTLSGGSGIDTLEGGAGVDTLNGDAGNDIFITNVASMAVGDVYDGGGDTDTIRVSDTMGAQYFNFNAATVSSIERIEFGSGAGTVAFFEFYGSQVGAGFANTTQVAGSTLVDVFNITNPTVANFSLAGWTFSSWSANDEILLTGSASNDTITGSSQADFLDGGAGVDILDGGGGDDRFTVTLDNLESGDQFHGDVGADTIRVQDNDTAQYFNFNGAAVSSIERIEFASTLGSVAFFEFYASQLGAGFSSTLHIIGSDIVNVFNITSPIAGVASLAGWTFENWNSTDEILLNGGSDDDTLTGSSVTDRITGAGGADTLGGWGGRDRIEGGAGNDTITGGDDVDTAIYAVDSASASWVRNANGAWTVTAGGEGVDTVASVEFLDFTDRDVFLDRAVQTFSGNGTSDILFRRADGVIASWDVTGVSINSASFLPTAGAEWTPLGSGDISGDGRDDVLWQRTDGTVYAWLMNGGAISSAVALTGVGAEWTFLGMGDFNGDLIDDFAWQRNDGLVYSWTMNNAAIASANPITGLGAAEWGLEGIGDFNGDGRDDFLWRRSDTGQTVVWQMNGASIQTGGETSVQATLDWNVAGVGDVNGDGRDDIIMQRESDGMVALWAMDGMTVLSTTNVAAANPLNWALQSIGDYNGDGRDDILWQRDDGVVYAWLMNGATIIDSGGLSGVGPEWTIVGGG